MPLARSYTRRRAVSERVRPAPKPSTSVQNIIVGSSWRRRRTKRLRRASRSSSHGGLQRVRTAPDTDRPSLGHGFPRVRIGSRQPRSEQRAVAHSSHCSLVASTLVRSPVPLAALRRFRRRGPCRSRQADRAARSRARWPAARLHLRARCLPAPVRWRCVSMAARTHSNSLPTPASLLYASPAMDRQQTVSGRGFLASDPPCA